MLAQLSDLACGQHAKKKKSIGKSPDLTPRA